MMDHIRRKFDVIIKKKGMKKKKENKKRDVRNIEETLRLNPYLGGRSQSAIWEVIDSILIKDTCVFSYEILPLKYAYTR